MSFRRALPVILILFSAGPLLAQELFDSYSITIRNRDGSRAEALEFPEAPGEFVLSDQYVEIAFPEAAYEAVVEIYTDNFDGTPCVETWGYQYGGMMNTFTGNEYRIPLLWQISEDTDFPDPGPPTEESGWIYVKDRADLNIPDDVYDDELPPGEERPDESWPAASEAGYTRFILSTVTYTSGSANIFFETFFADATPGDYETDIWLDFYFYARIPEEELSVSGVIGPDGGKLAFRNGTYLYVPPGALDEDTLITLTRLSTETFRTPPTRAAGDFPIAAYRFEPEGMFFNMPADFGIYAMDAVDVAGRDLRSFRWDEMFEEWEMEGGRPEFRETGVFISCHLRNFSVHAIYEVESLSADDFRPRKSIITPDGDGINDTLVFQGLSGVDTEVRIFDITGRTVKTLTEDPYIWDGTDGMGNTVESGIYVYQFNVTIDGKSRLVSGVVAVAR